MSFWMWGFHNLFENGIINILRQHLAVSEENEAFLTGCGFVLCVLVAYLLGSVNWALVISRVFFHDDVRRHGSGNAGATNVLRTYGKKAALLTFLGDGLKGVVSVLFAALMFGYPITMMKTPTGNVYDIHYIHLLTAVYLAAAFCVLGHIFPCFAKFKGGKGVATTAFCVLTLNPGIFLVLILMFAILLIGTHYVSLGSVTTAAFYPILLHTFDSSSTQYGVGTLFAFLIAALVIWSHRANIKRLLNHTESKTYLGKKPATATDGNKKEGV